VRLVALLDQSDTSENNIQDWIFENWEQFLRQSEFEKNKIARSSLQIRKGLSKTNKKQRKPGKNHQTQPKGFDISELK